MGRLILEPETLESVSGFSFSEPVRFAFKTPRYGGFKLADIRNALKNCGGRLRFSGTAKQIFVDVDAGPEEPLIALDMMARSDADGLERAILSALDQIDYISVSVDGRSDEETLHVARAYADSVQVFQATDIGMTEEDWTADKINFANARNFGRVRLPTPWSLVLDTDECLVATPDMREVVRAGKPKIGAYGIVVAVEPSGQTNDDHHRLARSSYRWYLESHNQLMIEDDYAELDGARILHRLDLRAEKEIARRDRQRNGGIEGMEQRAKAGDLHALFHLAKHRIADDHPEAFDLVQEFRFRAEVEGPLADERTWVALYAAARHYNNDNYDQARVWCLRTLLDGPRAEPLCLLGDIAEDRGDLETAKIWYEMACAVPDRGRLRWTTLLVRRRGRLEGIKRALAGLLPREPEENAEGHPRS